MRTRRLLSAVFLATTLAPLVEAEPMFLSKQYTRCVTCHFSPTGGGLLTAYGRSLSKEELSTFKSEGLALGDSLGGLQLGVTLRPARLEVDFARGSFTRNFIMNAGVTAAYQKDRWTLYAEIARQDRTPKAEIDSFEHWVAFQSAKGVGIRAGRFLPAYGVRLADHTTYTRRSLGFDMHDQIYGVELSRSSERALFQVSLGPGRAASLVDDDGTAAFTASARAQFDLSGSKALVLSALRRAASDRSGADTLGGVAFGFAPSRRWSVWSEGNVRSQEGRAGSSYTLANETSFEAHRGLWLKFTPQLRTNPGDTGGGVIRTGAAIDWLPRTHVNLGLLYYRDKDRRSSAVTKTLLAQVHLYF